MIDEESGDFLSYAEVDRMSDGIASILRDQREGANEDLAFASESGLGKLLALLGILKAGISIPSQDVSTVLRISELVTSGHAKTLLLNKGVALASSECTPACAASGQHESEVPRPSPGGEASRSVRYLHVVDPAGCSRHIELADPVATTASGSRGQRSGGGRTVPLVDLLQLAGSVSEASTLSQGPAFPAHFSPALVQLLRRTPAPILVRAPEGAPALCENGTAPAGRAVVPPRTPAPSRVCSLTRAETAVARLVAEGMTNKEIADHLVLSVHTVGTHVRSSFTKLNVTNRVALAREVIFYDCAQQSAGGLV
ncbi:response regulator transcription factor [Streptomyces albidoflavus]